MEGNTAPASPAIYQTTPCTISWQTSVAPTGIAAVNLGSVNPIPVTFTYANSTVTVPHVPIGPDPIALYPVAVANPTPTPTPTPPPVVVQSAFKQYGGTVNNLSVTFSKAEITGDTVVVDVPPGSTSVSDNNGDTFTKTATNVTVNINGTSTVCDVWTATGIHGATWNVSTACQFPNATNPSMMATEQKP